MDISGNHYDGVLYGSYVYDSQNGGSISNSFISTSYNINSSSFTISMIVTFNPSYYWAVWWGDECFDANLGYYAFMSSYDTLNFAGGGTNSYNGRVEVNISPNLYNVRSLWDFVVNGANFYLYRNGILFSGPTIYTTPLNFSSVGLCFGARHLNNGLGYRDANGRPTFYNLRAYNIALTSTQVLTNYYALQSKYSL